MTPLEIEFIQQTISSTPKPYNYYRDKYALQLLKYHVKNQVKINELKSSRYQGLLGKQVVNDMIKACSHGVLYSEALQSHYQNNWEEEGKGFNYTVSKWGEYVSHRNDSWNQTSRPGYNLVLQLNFDDWHNCKYHQLVKNEYGGDPFIFCSHPVAEQRHFTMAWARLDIDLDCGEVLIEEIQNDWLREVISLKKALGIKRESQTKWLKKHWFFKYSDTQKFIQYAEFTAQYQKIWQEAILSLAIQFAKEELGIDTVYYHQFDSGNKLKGLEHGSKPPKSLYTHLPKRFCFEQTREAPEFIKKEKYLRKKLKNNDLSWWKLSL